MWDVAAQRTFFQGAGSPETTEAAANI
jgi:hypothetical protein